MANRGLGRTRVIANPAARSGAGAQAAAFTQRFFSSYTSASSSFELVLTQAPGDATHLAAQTHDVDTLVVLGGDGVIHEAVDGIMRLPREVRPTLAVIPMGSGNDFARTLHASTNDPGRSLAEVLAGGTRTIDLGHITSNTGNESHIVQTLSFGLDAAIGLDTMSHRGPEAAQRGASLFVTSGLKIIAQGVQGYSSVLTIDGEPPQHLQTIMCAVQNGPTYGGGFRICPAAVPTDGMLDICYNVRTPTLPHLAALFGRAHSGHHVSSPVVHVGRIRHLSVSFPEVEPPCQVDGEAFGGTRFEVDVIPGALDVVVPPACPW